jgi:uncharacterized protein YqjF (DUF2071 family)
MNAIIQQSQAAKENLEKNEGGAHLLCDWVNVVFIHYEVQAKVLQPAIPFQLDFYEGKAYVSLVAFTLKQFRFSKWEGLTQLMMKPIATHKYFNVRTYVKQGEAKGIYFIKEWISNSLCAAIGSHMYELPCQYGKLHYQCNDETKELVGHILPGDVAGQYQYQFTIPERDKLTHVEKNSLDEFLLERYLAFVKGKRNRRYFRIWHDPWMQVSANVIHMQDDLMIKLGPWGNTLKFAWAHYSPGVFNVWMGKPQQVAL